MVSSLEDQLKQTSAQLSTAKDSALELEAEVSKVKLIADQAQRTAEDMERRLSRRAGELQASEEKCSQLQRKLGKMFALQHVICTAISQEMESFSSEVSF